MDRSDAEWAADLLGDLIRRRVEIAAALAAGEYDSASEMAAAAIGVSDEVARRIDGLAPEAAPHRAMAAVLHADYRLALVLAGGRAGTSVPVGYDGGLERDLEAFGAMRECPHGRPSWDGNCVARPPCPSAGG